MTKRYAIYVGALLGMLLVPFGSLILADLEGFVVALRMPILGGAIGGLAGLVVCLVSREGSRGADTNP